jgi:hypothetical protein
MNITMLARSGAFINLIDLLMMTGLFFAFILAAFSGRLFSTPIRNFVIMMIVVYGLLKPTSDIMIIDQRTGYNYNVSNVPLGVALFGYFQSSLSSDLVNFFENTLNNGNYYASYAKYGFGFGPFSTKAIVEYMNSPAIGNGNPEYGRLITNLSKFSQECFGYSAAQGNNNMALMAIKAMPVSNDAFKIFLGQDQSYPYINPGLTMDYLNSNGSYQSFNCQDAGSRIYNDVQNFVRSSQVDQNFVNNVQGMLSANPTSLATNLQTALQYHFNSLSQLDNLKMNILFSSMSYDFVKLGATGLSNSADVSNYAVNSILGSAKMSAIQQAVENFGQGAVAVALAPKMLNFTKMMYYLLFFVLLTLALTPLARAIGKVTLVFFVFLTILEPLYVLLNYLLNTMAYYQAASSGTCNNSPAGILSCLDINSLFYTNVLNFSILGLIGLAYMLASAMVTGSGAVIGAIGEKFGSGAITYQGANNNVGSLSNFVNDPVKMLAAQNTSTSSFISGGGASFQSGLANYLSTQMGMRATELGASFATYDSTRGTVTKDGYTNIDGVKYSNVRVNSSGLVSDFKTAEGTLGQLIKGLTNSGDVSLAKLASSLRLLADNMGGGVSATVTKGKDGYTIEFDMGQAGTSGKQSIILDKNGNFTQGSIKTDKGLLMVEGGTVKINGEDVMTKLQKYQQDYENAKYYKIGSAFAKQLKLGLNHQEAVVLGKAISNSNSTQDLMKTLQEISQTRATEVATAVQQAVKDFYTKEHIDKYGYKLEGGIKLNLSGIGLGGLTLSKEEAEAIRKGTTEETARILSNKFTQMNQEKYAEQFATIAAAMKMSQLLSRKEKSDSEELQKAFSQSKQVSNEQTFGEKEAAAFAQEMAQRLGIDINPEGLQLLTDAVKSGDQGKIISAFAQIASNPKYRSGQTTDELVENQNNIKNLTSGVVEKVEGKTSNVENEAKKAEKEALDPRYQKEVEKAENNRPVHVNIPKPPEEPEKPKIPKPQKPPAVTITPAIEDNKENNQNKPFVTLDGKRVSEEQLRRQAFISWKTGGVIGDDNYNQSPNYRPPPPQPENVKKEMEKDKK